MGNGLSSFADHFGIDLRQLFGNGLVDSRADHRENARERGVGGEGRRDCRSPAASDRIRRQRAAGVVVASRTAITAESRARSRHRDHGEDSTAVPSVTGLTSDDPGMRRAVRRGESGCASDGWVASRPPIHCVNADSGNRQMLAPFETFFTRRNQEVMSMVVPTITGPNRHWRLLRLAEIWPPYDPAGSVIVGTKPLGPE